MLDTGIICVIILNLVSRIVVQDTYVRVFYMEFIFSLLFYFSYKNFLLITFYLSSFLSKPIHE